MEILSHGVKWEKSGVLKHLMRRIKEFAVKQFFLIRVIANYHIQLFEKFQNFILKIEPTDGVSVMSI